MFPLCVFACVLRARTIRCGSGARSQFSQDTKNTLARGQGKSQEPSVLFCRAVLYFAALAAFLTLISLTRWRPRTTTPSSWPSSIMPLTSASVSPSLSAAASRVRARDTGHGAEARVMGSSRRRGGRWLGRTRPRCRTCTRPRTLPGARGIWLAAIFGGPAGRIQCAGCGAMCCLPWSHQHHLVFSVVV